MSVAHVVHVFPTFVAAGAQVRTVALMNGLSTDYRHSVLSLAGPTDALRLVDEGVDAGPIELGAAPASGPARGVRRMRALLAAQQPDLLCTYNWGSFDAVLAARSSGFGAHLHHEDGFNADEAVGQKRRRVWSRRLFLRGAHGVVVISERLRELALRSWRLPERRVHFIPNGVRLERFGAGATDGARVRSELDIPARALVVGTVGHLRPVKRFDRLIEACARVRADRPVHLLLIGDGELRKALEEQARATDLAVHFAGHQDELAPYYAAMDVFCLSSDSEQQPISMLEAMASRVPVVATDVGDIRAMLPPAAGEHLCPLATEGTPAAFARALERMLTAPAVRAELAELGLARVRERFSETAMIANYAQLYEQAMQRAVASS
ncbi:MAG: glycosyltransferase [bacterium]|nr:glycosyltransferase [bacterium]